jgi:hypothetical protein
VGGFSLDTGIALAERVGFEKRAQGFALPP